MDTGINVYSLSFLVDHQGLDWETQAAGQMVVRSDLLVQYYDSSKFVQI